MEDVELLEMARKHMPPTASSSSSKFFSEYSERCLSDELEVVEEFMMWMKRTRPS